MKATPFTPEPLFVHDETEIVDGKRIGTFDIKNKELSGEDCKWIGDVKPYGRNVGRFPDYDEAKAYAKLFAASPDLLECLKDCVENILIDLPDDDPRKLRYRAAIEKATV